MQLKIEFEVPDDVFDHEFNQAQFTADVVPADKGYDPRYDPLIAATPGTGRAYAPTWWVASAGTPPDDDGPVIE